MAALVFIDTNIFLDFYRVRAKESALSILDHLDGNHESIVTGSQVEMEFKKNRQRVILESYRQIKPPSFEGVSQLPAFLSESKQSSALGKSDKQVKALSKKLKQRTLMVLKNPTTNDPVYKSVQRLFRCDSPYNLDRVKKVRFSIRRLARKRFSLGYPPRKAGDTSMGDAVNWEWIIHCALESGKDVVIVTRDSDYGASFENEIVLNDWLGQEFRERVSRKRKIRLTDRLADGLRAADIGVTSQEEAEEEEFMEERLTIPATRAFDLGDVASRSQRLRALLAETSGTTQLQDALREALAPSEALREAVRAAEAPSRELRELLDSVRQSTEALRKLKPEE